MNFALSLAAFIFCFSAASLHAGETGKDPNPPPTEIKFWRFDADIDSRRSATLLLGETIDQVIAKLGEPRSRSKKKKDPINQEIRYVRKIYGPVHQRQVATRDGSTTIRYQVIFIDEITLFFKNGTLQNVKTYRTQSSSNNQDGLPSFMQ